jgi:hypothetical protein
MPESIELKRESFWKLNFGKIRYLFLAATAIGLTVSIGLTTTLHFSHKQEPPLWIIPWASIGLGLFLTLIMLVGSWYAFGQTHKYLGRVVIDSDKNIRDWRYVYSDKGSKWHFYELQIQGYYKDRAFTVYYEPLYDQYNDQRGLHLWINAHEEIEITKIEGKNEITKYSQQGSRLFIPLRELKNSGHINLCDYLSKMDG